MARPEYFGRGNLIDLFLANLAVLIVAAGMTLVMLTGEIDISVGSAFAVCGVAAGVLAKAGVPTLMVSAAVCALGALIGAVNGSLVAYLRLPSIVVTLAMMIALRDALRWMTQGAWVQDLPAGLPVVRAVAARVSVRRRTARRGDRRGARLGPAIYRRRPAASMRRDRAARPRGSPASTRRSSRCARSPRSAR